MIRKIITFLMLFSVITLNAQNDYEYRYWFDYDESEGVYLGTSSTNQWNLDIDMSQVANGLHTIHIQVKDTMGWGLPVTKKFVKTPPQITATLFYCIDDGPIMSMSIVDATSFELDVTSIDDGLHKLVCYVQTSEGVMSTSYCRYFLKISEVKNVQCTIYIDDNIYSRQDIAMNSPILDIDLDIDSLSVGLHRLTVQLSTPYRQISHSRLFYRGITKEEQSAVKCYFSIDEMVDSISVVHLKEDSFFFDFDASYIAEGMHTFSAKFVNSANEIIHTHSSLFYRAPLSCDISSVKCYYSIDGVIDGVQLGNGNGIFNFNIDAAQLPDGLHMFTYMFRDNNNIGTSPRSLCFYKQSQLEFRKYEYWLNDDYDKRTSVTFDTPQVAFTLMELLPVDVVPIRSELFHFEVMDGAPTVVAKNMFNVMFFYGKQMVRESKSYIDYNVSEVIDSLVDITHLTRHTTTVPAENEIKWYKFYSEEGDSVSFYTDKACTVHLFDSLGNELYQAQGIEALQANGTYTMHNGTYYIALHDVTQNGSNVTLHYMHLDKYAVVDYDTHCVGNGGVSTIALNGNGYYSLKSIELRKGDLSIYSFDIEYLSNSKLKASFDFFDCATGLYDMILHFVDEDLVVSNAVEVSDAIEIVLTSDVSFTSTFLQGTTTLYNLSITNNGNMTAYRVPIYTYINCGTNDAVKRVKYYGVDLPSAISGIDMDGFTSYEIAELNKTADEIGDNLHFVKLKSYDEVTGDSVYIRSNYVFIDLAPGETKELSLEVSTTESVEVYFTIPEDWNPVVLLNEKGYNSPRRRMANANFRDQYCCVKERVECIGSIISYGVTIADLIAISPNAQLATAVMGCITDVMNTTISAAGDVFCNENNVEKSVWDKIMQVSNGISVAETVRSCFLQKLSWGKFGDVMEILNTINTWTFGKADATVSCITAFSTKKPGCPPTPPKGGTSSPVQSYDPNDILGYVSPSGTNYIGIEQQTISYTIEFENDSTMATASARQVVLCDTLDKEIFDLATLSPRYIIIGGRRIELDGVAPFVKTIDMRPEINTILQVELEYDSTEGVSRWIFSSLDPMTLQPVELMENGFLPINDENGRGQGSVTFDITLQPHLADGTIVENVADIIFDNNEAIVTPVWVNETDYVYPVSWVGNLEIVNDSTINVVMGGEDTRSGIWKYDLYVSTSVDNRWQPVATDIMEEGYIYHVEKDVEYSFCTVATDMAGNREPKDLAPEYYYVNGKVYSDVHYIEQDAANEDDNVYYDLRGIRVENPGPGIYVRKGKKVVIYRR